MEDTFGKRLKKLRSAKGKQQKEVAIDLEISKGTYSLYESDLRMPGVNTLLKIADYYNASTDYLLCRDNKATVDINKISMDLQKLKKYIDSMQNYIDEIK